MLKLEATTNTPLIEFNTQTGVLNIKGKSLTENATEYYQPLIEKIIEYKKRPCLKTELNIYLVYFNTSSSKAMLDIFHHFESVKSNSEVIVNWYFEKGDEDMLEVGEDYREIVSLPFKMIEY